MTEVRFRLNGRTIAADVEPRQHLADFLREEALLTGTHLGCEHGVCGACTVLIDGAPARSCIAFPVALDGASVTTIEGLEDDPLTGRLREAFSAEHALQCGFCTPGMLITARDIVLRRPAATPDMIRHELAGNLCRCTGYIGIVRAIAGVAGERLGQVAVVTRGSIVDASAQSSPLRLPVNPSRRVPQAPPASARSGPNPPPASSPPETLRNPVRLTLSFDVPAPREKVWAFFQDPARVVACLPGARLTAPTDGRTFLAEMIIKLGPIQANVAGSASLFADGPHWRGGIDGRGLDARSATRIQARLTYQLIEAEEGRTTTVDVEVAYALQGPLAQVSRGMLARDLAARMTRRFAADLSIALNETDAPTHAAALDAGSLLLSVLKDWVRRLLRRD